MRPRNWAAKRLLNYHQFTNNEPMLHRDRFTTLPGKFHKSSEGRPAMFVKHRPSTRHMKGKQVALTLYLPPRKYWLLKSVSHRSGYSMQVLLRRALDEALAEAHRGAPFR